MIFMDANLKAVELKSRINYIRDCWMKRMGKLYPTVAKHLAELEIELIGLEK